MATVKGTWRFNDVFSVANIAELGADIIFTSNKTEYALIGVFSEGTDCVMLYSATSNIDDAVFVYSSVLSDGNVPITNIGWQSEAYKTITITEEQEVSDEFYAWLTANATRIDEEETPIATITYNGETLETLNGGEYITLHTKGQMMEDDIRVEVAEESGGGGDIAINGIVEQYEVNAGATINAGDFVEFVNKFGGGIFEDGNLTLWYVTSCKLDNNHVLVIYGRQATDGKAVVLRVGDASVTVGETITFATRVPMYPSAVALSDSKAIVVYGDNANNGRATAIILTIDDTTITTGEKVTFTSDEADWFSAEALTDSKVIVTYRIKGDGIRARVLGISDTTITFGEEKTIVINSGYAETRLSRLSENSVILAIHFEYKYYLYVLTISGTTVSNGTAYEINGIKETGAVSVAALSASKAIIAYNTSSARATCTAVTIDGNAISVIGSADFSITSQANYISTVALSDSKVLVAYQAYLENKTGKAVVLTVSDTSITAGTPVVFDYNSVTWTSVVAFSHTSALVVACNNLNTGAYATLSIDGTTITADSAEIGTYVQPATSRLHNVGVAKTSGTEGQMVDVYCV